MLKSLQVFRRMSTVDIACKFVIAWCNALEGTSFLNSQIFLSALRVKYREKRDVFREETIVKKEPIDLFGKWLDEATKTEEILEPNAMCLATVNKWVFVIDKKFTSSLKSNH